MSRENCPGDTSFNCRIWVTALGCTLEAVEEAQAAMIEDRFAAYFANWGLHLPRGVALLEEAGTIAGHGWSIRYFFGTEDGEPYLEYYATHRMTNDRRVQICGSGKVRSLEALTTIYGYRAEMPGDRERAARENRERNGRIADELEALGLYPVGNINAYLATHDVPGPEVGVPLDLAGPDVQAVSFADADELMDEIDRFLAEFD